MTATPELAPYLQILPTALISLVVAFLATPFIGVIAKRFRFVDLPKEQRKRTDRTLSTRIHKSAKLRLGGLAVLVPFIFVALTQLGQNPRIGGMIVGLLVLIAGGIIDDRYELTARKQMLFQLAAAVIVVLSGVTIAQITVAGITLDFSLFTQPIDLGLFVYNFVFPADFITIFWILAIINAINWMSGIDAIGELTTFIAAFTTMLLSVRAGQMDMAIMSGALAAGLLGFVPFNMPPSKIMSGTAGTTSYGFILAVFAVISGAKITSSLILLSLPLLDMLWVMIYRFIKLKNEPFLKRPFVGGDVHLHHRLMGLGLGQAQTLWLEISAISLISVLSFYVSGFSENFMAFVAIIAVLIVGFTIVSIISRRKKKLAEAVKKEEPPEPPMVDSGPTPEQRYAY